MNTASSTRPAFAFAGLQTTELGGWPQEADGSAEKFTRIFAYERQPWGVATSTKSRLGVGDEFVILGKVLWGRLDEATGTMWVRFDHLVATKKADRVMREARWVTFADFKSNFPRSQMSFKESSATFRNVGSTHINPDRHNDDFEPMFMVNNPDDHLDEDSELDFAQPLRMIDEARAKAFWVEEFGNGN